ncbi:MAG TPA: tripartite tricarboxylate transporter substrate-binding protein [Sphingomicrobium sp.]|nr:tripartite tricarboxylate transporter substrate-binding protein [Sphingomicrobium sp.]
MATMIPTMIGRRTAIATAVAAGALAGSMPGWAKGSYPREPAQRLVVPFAAGGTADCVARIVAQILNEQAGSTFVIENWTGAGGNVSAEIVAKARPDGRTLLLGTVNTAVTNQFLYRNIAYDCEQSFTPIALVAEVPNVLVVHPTFPAGTFEEFVHYCKDRGCDEVAYGSPGMGATGHLTMEYLQGQAGIRLRHVAYGSRSRMIRDLLAGNVRIAMDNLPAYLWHARSGALRALAVSSTDRWFTAPDVPSIAERGYPEFEASLWWYVAAPAGTRLELVKTLSDRIVQGLRSEAVVRKIRACGASERPGNAEELIRHMGAERAKWKKVIETAQLKPQG